MRKIVRRDEQPYLLDTDADLIIFDGQQRQGGNLPTRWLELWAHAVDDEEPLFYIVHRTLWQNENNYIEHIDKLQASLLVEENLDMMSEIDLQDAHRVGLLDLAKVK